MSNYIKVDGARGLVRDSETNAIINTNFSELDAYLKAKQSAMEREAKIIENEREISKLKDDICEIKDMLRILIKGNE